MAEKANPAFPGEQRRVFQQRHLFQNIKRPVAARRAVHLDEEDHSGARDQGRPAEAPGHRQQPAHVPVLHTKPRAAFTSTLLRFPGGWSVS